MRSYAVVFGDIGTSPLYTLPAVFQDLYGNSVVPKPGDIKGALCQIVWCLTCVVSLKYVLIMMMTGAFHGEGGTFALLHHIKASGSLVSRRIHLWRFFQAVAACAAALIVADGALTPVVTVSSAVEGIGLSVWRFNGSPGVISLDNGQPGTPSNYGRTCTVAAAVLVFIFLLQRSGSQRVGLLYSPVIITWLLWIGATGIQAIRAHGGSVFEAWNPHHLLLFWTSGTFRGEAAWHSLGGVFLSVTGAEALFADQGHFGLPAIGTAWFVLVYPMLLLCYTGQAAWLLSFGDLTDPRNPALCFSLNAASGAAAPGAGRPPFATYLSFPQAQPSCAKEGFMGVQGGSAGPSGVISNVFWFVAGGGVFGSAQYKGILAIATLASVVGSQALLTGVSTILKQASDLSLFPFFKIRHTSVHYEHQIYSGGVTGAMCVLCLFILGIFQHSANLTAVYGACVATAMLLTTVLYVGVARFSIRLPLLVVLAIVAPLLFMDASLASANVGKFFVSGPVQLSYPSNTYIQLQTAHSIGDMGPVPQNAWVAMVPLIVAVLVSLFMLSWLWGRSNVLLSSAKLSSYILYGRSLSAASAASLRTATIEIGALTPVEEGAEGEYQAAAVAAETVAAETNELSVGEYTVSAETLRKELAGLMSKDIASLSRRFTRLEDALARLSSAGKLERTPGIGIYVSSGASFYDTEPIESPDPSCVLALPKAFLVATSLGSLPATAIILDVRFLPGLAFLGPDEQRFELRQICRPNDMEEEAVDPGLWHIIFRFGFAEQPAEGDIISLLKSIGARHEELRGLAHAPCSVGHCKCGTDAPTPCLPVTFCISRDSLFGAGVLEWLPATVYNALQANSAGRASFLNLPLTSVVELLVHVDLAKLRGLRHRVEAMENEPFPPAACITDDTDDGCCAELGVLR